MNNKKARMIKIDHKTGSYLLSTIMIETANIYGFNTKHKNFKNL
jgi:hypothetical protein